MTVVAVYGYPLKSILHEKFGDGIVSAIDFQASVEKIKDEKTGADRAKITLNGKWYTRAHLLSCLALC